MRQIQTWVPLASCMVIRPPAPITEEAPPAAAFHSIDQVACTAEGGSLTARWLLVLALTLVPSGLARAQTGAPLEPRSESKLLASDGEDGDAFGWSVSASTDIALTGAYLDNDKGAAAGSAYVFVESGGAWSEQAKLLASDGGAGDLFGWSVSVSGNTALVSAPSDDDNGNSSGSAYVFIDSGGVWTEQSKLLASDGAATDIFGHSVSISGNTGLVGALQDDPSGLNSGSAYVFVRSEGVWTEQAKLVASDGAASDFFGYSASLSGDTALVGATGDDDNGSFSGSAYVFVRSGGAWVEQAKLLPMDGKTGDEFGFSVSLSADTALVGAKEANPSGPESGAAYVFVRSGGRWTEQAKLVASDGAAGDRFGQAVSLSPGTALVGAWLDDDNGADSGSAYIFVESGGVWTEQSKLLPMDGEAEDGFGHSVSLSGSSTLVGAPEDDDNGPEAGAAYAFASSTLKLSVVGNCPGPVSVTIEGAPPNSEVGTVAAANNNGFTKGGLLCNGTVFEIGEPFQLPPLWIKVDENGSGSGKTTLQDDRCWIEAMALASCETSGAVLVE